MEKEEFLKQLKEKAEEIEKLFQQAKEAGLHLLFWESSGKIHIELKEIIKS